MSPETLRFQQTLRNYAESQPHTIALWGDDLKLDYAMLNAEVAYRQQCLRDQHVKVVALALDNGTEAVLWDLAILFEGLTCLTLAPFSVRLNAVIAWSKAKPSWSLAQRIRQTNCRQPVTPSLANSGVVRSVLQTGYLKVRPN